MRRVKRAGGATSEASRVVDGIGLGSGGGIVSEPSWKLKPTMDRSAPMHLLSWNVDQLGSSKRIEAVAEAIALKKPDIVTLQEVRSRHAAEVAKALERCGLRHVWHSHDPPPCSRRQVEKAYNCVIASRWPVDPPSEGDAWRCRAPFPEVLGRVLVEAPAGKIDVFTAHIPHGSGHKWKKVETFDTLAVALRNGTDSPRVLTGDFNEPKQFLSSGQIVSFGERQVGKHGPMLSLDGCWRGRRRVHWANGVRAVLAGTSHHGLRDAYRERYGFAAATPVTHRTTGGNPRCFDHTFVSRHFEVADCGYYHEWRRRRLSDHSGMWTKLGLRTDVPRLDNWEQR